RLDELRLRRLGLRLLLRRRLHGDRLWLDLDLRHFDLELDATRAPHVFSVDWFVARSCSVRAARAVPNSERFSTHEPRQRCELPRDGLATIPSPRSVRRFAFSADTGRMATLTQDTGKKPVPGLEETLLNERAVTDDEAARALPTGHARFARGRELG